MADMAKLKTKPARRVKTEAKGRMRNFLMFLPNMVKLLGRISPVKVTVVRPSQY